MRVIFPAKFVYNHIGTPDISGQNKMLFEGSANMNVDFVLPSNFAGLKF